MSNSYYQFTMLSFYCLDSFKGLTGLLIVLKLNGLQEPVIGAYTSISDLILGFDRKVLQSAFKVVNVPNQRFRFNTHTRTYIFIYI